MSANKLCDDAGVIREAVHFFSQHDGRFHPTEASRAGWGDSMISGPAVVGLAAHCLERDFGADGFLPTRLTTDLFKAALRVPTEVRTRLVRDGRRIRGSECDVLQDGVIVARATMVQFRQSAPPPGEEWIGEESFVPPQGVQGTVYFIDSDGIGWGHSAAVHQNTSRKRVYHRTVDVIEGQTPSPFVRTVVAAEATSLVTNLGTEGIGYINGDLTVAISRLPIGEYVGVQADSHWANNGIAVGAATLFDDEGPFGTGMVTAIANPAAQIDFRVTDIPTREV